MTRQSRCTLNNDIYIWDFFSRNQLSSTLKIQSPFVSDISGLSNYISSTIFSF